MVFIVLGAIIIVVDATKSSMDAKYASFDSSPRRSHNWVTWLSHMTKSYDWVTWLSLHSQSASWYMLGSHMTCFKQVLDSEKVAKGATPLRKKVWYIFLVLYQKPKKHQCTAPSALHLHQCLQCRHCTGTEGVIHAPVHQCTGVHWFLQCTFANIDIKGGDLDSPCGRCKSRMFQRQTQANTNFMAPELIFYQQ